MWGDNPNKWHDELIDDERYRIIINYLTRMRFVDKNCALDLKNNRNSCCWLQTMVQILL